MANNPQLSDTAANAACNAITALLNSGFLDILTAPQPANANTAITTQTLLASLTFGATAFAAASGGIATANAITSATAGATGTAAWFRCYKSDHTTVVFDGSAGTSLADMILNTASIVSGANVAITSMTFQVKEH